MQQRTRYGTTVHSRKVVQEPDAYNSTNGRQGKRPAVGAAHVVGRIEEFTNVANTRCWRFRQIVQAFQGFERHRSELPGGAAP